MHFVLLSVPILQLRKSNDELSVVDAQCLEQVTRDLPTLTKHVESLKADQKSHQRLLHEFSMKQQERMMSWGMMPPRGPGGVPLPPGYQPPPGGMMRMRSPYPRSMDPRQIEFEMQQQQRIRMLQAGGGRPPPAHPMTRPPYMEVCT